MQTSAISSGVSGVSTSFFCIRTMSSPLKFWMTMNDSSSKAISILSNGVSERNLMSPFRAEYTMRIIVLFP